MIPFPDKKYRVIYDDPPWRFSSKGLQSYNGKRFNPLEVHYKTQSNDWIKSLPVSGIAEDDSCLFLWVTDAHLQEGLEVIKAWGFKYITVAFVWHKITKTGKTAVTLGAWNMKGCELCLFATKGRMKQYKKSNNVYQLVEAERTVHSRKPNEVRCRIVSMFGDVPRIELFARERLDGWDSWGDEV